MPKIRFKSGLESTMPQLSDREPGFTKDTKKLFVGSDEGNIEFAKQSDLDTKANQSDLNTTNTNLSANTTEINNARGAFPVLKDRLDDVTSSLAQIATLPNGNTTSDINTLVTKENPILPTGDYTINGTINFVTKTKLESNKGAKITSTNTGGTDFNVTSSNVDIVGAEIVGTAGNNTFVLNQDVQDFSISHSKITSKGNAFNISALNIKNLNFINNKINAFWYGILLDSASKSGENLSIINNDIYAAKSDAIEINLPNQTDINAVFKSIRIIGNTLATGNTDGGTTTAGFAIGLANVKNTSVVGNTITRSRRDAIHVEDGQDSLVITANTAKECDEGGLIVFRATAGSIIDGKPSIITSNYFKKSLAKWKTGNGIYNELPLANISDNNVEGFDKGIFIASNGKFNMNNNTVIDCNIGVEVVKDAQVLGTTFTRNCTTLVQAGRNTVIGKIISETTPTKILRYYDTTNRMGATLKGFQFPTSPVTMTAGETKTIDLFDLVDVIKGKLTVSISSVDYTMSHALVSAQIDYNGGILTVSDSMKKMYGTLDTSGSPFFVVNGSKLALKLYTSANQSFNGFEVNFDGDYYSQTYSV